MPRTASLALIAHMSSSSATIAYLQKTGPLPDDSYCCMNSTARDIVYDDGGGPRTYYARTGIQMANLAGTNDLSSDNTEAQTLTELPTYPGQGITVPMVENGDLDGVEYLVYAINYMDHSMGHMIVAGGPIGQVRVTPDRQLITIELRAWCDLMRQNSVIELWSLTCRARFGSQVGEERYPCRYDLSGEWVNNIPVTAIGVEVLRDFTASSLLQATGYFKPGLAEWVSGANEGRRIEVENFTSGGVLSLRFMVRHPIQVGDLFNLRRNCTNRWGRVDASDPIETNSCLFFGNEEWFRGEPFQPVADSVALTVPGAAHGGY